MSERGDSKPCPYCGELIKVQAVKCRHCGEFLDDAEGGDRPRRRDEERYEGPLTWLIPVGRSGWAMISGWAGLLALLPYLLFVFLGADFGDAQKRLAIVLACINVLLGVVAILAGVIALILIGRSGKKSGIGRAIFGILAGLLGTAAYLLIAFNIETVITRLFQDNRPIHKKKETSLLSPVEQMYGGWGLGPTEERRL